MSQVVNDCLNRSDISELIQFKFICIAHFLRYNRIVFTIQLLFLHKAEASLHFLGCYLSGVVIKLTVVESRI